MRPTFATGEELVDSGRRFASTLVLGRALISILLVFAQMEREAVGERTRGRFSTSAAAAITSAGAVWQARRSRAGQPAHEGASR